MSPFNLETEILQYGECGKNYVIDTLSPFFVLSSWSPNYAHVVYLAGPLVSLTFFSFLFYCFSWSFWLILWDISSTSISATNFLIPRSFCIPNVTPLLLPSYSFWFLLLGCTDFPVSLKRVLLCFRIIFSSLFFPSCFSESCLFSFTLSTTEVSSDVFHLFWTEMGASWLEALNVRDSVSLIA